MNNPPLVRVRYFIWTVVPMSLYVIYLLFGLPHLIWSYDWQPQGPDSFNDLAQRYYTRCTYVGPNGPIIDRPIDGKCGWLRFAEKAGSW